MKPVGLCQALRWKDQEMKDAIAWHTAKQSIATDKDRLAFTAGYEQGYRAALSALSLHGHLQIDRDR